ncbi:protein BRANCHLESS TRICHOME [Herrania umbratica]|uniref:Protein BRANCHLESS TRICHOME n=1 Tax=Herrania umbratica TaxID=108875 RepID=A0A6J0ZVL1_9ROSI|nr:protein BRANCHLESS TRICHOME [Herrania umbratica]XP_021278840.1 protein BRANCHLESS TRICHOME [Herrania umbratica]XP_021278848.1 protein BRANCHLESS TRICHOME [Herrania umbratica]XP_021278857.1 protein BRANCHLESS TRICHOME [Herrania umbratica]
MEEAMMMISSPDNPSNVTIPQEHITTTTCPSWKLYENPFYYSHHHHHHQQQQQLCQSSKHPRQVNFPLSARKIAASFWDLTFFKPVMESELDIARAQIIELKAEVEYERKARKKVESLNKRLAKELAEERRGREALERVCEELAREISLHKAEIDRMKKEFEEERKMLRMAEVLREERVQMKLAEAKILFEEKLLELEETKRTQTHTSISRIERKNKEDKTASLSANLSGKFSRLVFSEKSCDYSNIGVDSGESTRFALSEKSSSCYDNISSGVSSSLAIQRKVSPEPENPHIKRGIKGFVEFPRVVRAIGSKSRHWGTKLECQKAQLRILLKQKSPIRSNSLIMS